MARHRSPDATEDQVAPAPRPPGERAAANRPPAVPPAGWPTGGQPAGGWATSPGAEETQVIGRAGAPASDETGVFTRALLSGLGGEEEQPGPQAPVHRPPGGAPTTATGRAASAVERGGVRAVEGTRRLAGKVAGLRGDERTALVAIGGVLAVVLIGIVALVVVVRLTVGDPPAAPATAAPPATSAAPKPSPQPVQTPDPEPTGSPLPPAGGEFSARHSGFCLAVPMNRTDDGAQLVQRPCGVGPDTGFYLLLKPNRTDAYSLVSTRTGKCVDVLGANAGDGAPVGQWECVGNDNQTFELRPVEGNDGYVQIVAGHSGKCLDVTGASRDENAPITQYECHDPAREAELGNQSFKLNPG